MESKFDKFMSVVSLLAAMYFVLNGNILSATYFLVILGLHYLSSIATSLHKTMLIKSLELKSHYGLKNYKDIMEEVED